MRLCQYSVKQLRASENSRVYTAHVRLKASESEERSMQRQDLLVTSPKHPVQKMDSKYARMILEVGECEACMSRLHHKLTFESKLDIDEIKTRVV